MEWEGRNLSPWAGFLEAFRTSEFEDNLLGTEGAIAKDTNSGIPFMIKPRGGYKKTLVTSRNQIEPAAGETVEVHRYCCDLPFYPTLNRRILLRFDEKFQIDSKDGHASDGNLLASEFILAMEKWVSMRFSWFIQDSVMQSCLAICRHHQKWVGNAALNQRFVANEWGKP